MDKLLDNLRGTATPNGHGTYRQCNVYVEPFSEDDKPDKDVESVLLENRSLQSLFRELVSLREKEFRMEAINDALRSQIERLQQENGRFKGMSANLDAWRLRLLTELEVEKIRVSRKPQKKGKPKLSSAGEAPVTADKVGTPDYERQASQTAQRPEAALLITDIIGSTPAEPPRRPDVDGNAIVRVLHYAMPPPRLLPHSLAYGPQSPWCMAVRTLKSLSLVRKAWHDAATFHLYSDIVLRRPGQIVALARTIKSAPHKFGVLVRSLILSCEVPECLLRIIRDSLADIIDYCPHLTGISFQGTFPVSALLGPSYLPCLFTSYAGDGNYINLPLPSRLQHLGLHDDRYANQFKPSFLALLEMELPLTNLVSFSIHAGSFVPSVEIYPLLFPRLETITFWSTPADKYFHVPYWWNMPKLKSLRFRPEMSLKDETKNSFNPFFIKYGPKLTNVDFGGNLSWPADTEKFERQVHALSKCPNLEHVVLRVTSPEHLRLLKRSPAFFRPIEHVDLVVKGSLCPAPSATKSFKHHEGSKWKHVRYLDIYLLRWAPDVPYIFPPWHDEQDDRIHIQDFYGLQIKESASELALYHSPLYGEDDANPNQAGPSGGADSDDDSEYRPSSLAESSDDSSSSLSDAEPDELPDGRTMPSYGMPNVTQLTEDEALSIYSGTLEHVGTHFS